MIGIDVTSVNRIKNMYEKFGRRAYERFLDDEVMRITNAVMRCQNISLGSSADCCFIKLTAFSCESSSFL